MASATRLYNSLLALTLPPLPSRSRWYPPLLIAGLIALGLLIAWLPLEAIILLAGGVLFGAMLLRWPVIALYLLIPVIPFSPLLAIEVGGVRVGAMELLIAAAAAVWGLQLLARRQTIPQNTPIFWAFILFIGAVSLSWLDTFSLAGSLVETVKWIEMLVLYVLVIALIPREQLVWVIGAILLTGTAQAAIGLYQFVFRVGPDGFLLFGGLFLRAYGTFAQPNPYAGYLGLILPLVLALTFWLGQQAFASRTAWQKHALPFLAVSIPLGVMVLALFATQSRSGWVAFAVAAAITLMLLSRQMIVLFATGAVIGAMVLLAGTFDLGQLTPADTESPASVIIQRVVDAAEFMAIEDIAAVEVTDANFSVLERLAHWQAAREMWRDNPWLGVGFGNYAAIYPAYAVGRWLDPLGHAHNYLLNIGAEAGLLGITAYLIFWIWTFAVTYRGIRYTDGLDRAVAVGVLGIFIHLHVHNMFDNLYVQGMYLHLAILMALVSMLGSFGKPIEMGDRSQ